MFRILQEALTNVHRHSGSRTALVRLFVNGDAVVLEVSDEGKGIAPELLNRVRNEGALGIGLRGMTERMHQLGGELNIESTCQKGTTITAIAPIRQERVFPPKERSASSALDQA